MKELHPASAAVLLAALLLLSAFSTDAAVVCLSLCGALTLCALLGNAKGQIKLCATLISVFALTNPFFSQAGETVLFYLNGHAVTLESVTYGARIGGMMAATLCWFAAFTKILDTERLLYLFGRALPKTALLLCACNRLIPLIGRRYGAASEALTASDMTQGDRFSDRVRAMGRTLTVTLAFSMESAVQSGFSMCARGYGLPNRTAGGQFRFSRSDGGFLVLTVLLTLLCTVGFATERLLGAVCFGLLCALPSLREGREILRWKA